MSYTRSLIVAVALSLAWIMGDPAVAMGPRPDPQPAAQSLMSHLRDYPDDVSALETLAAAYVANESYDAAIGPLARALQLAPTRRSLWVALDNALKQSGRKTISDAELTQRAAAFVGAIRMWDDER